MTNWNKIIVNQDQTKIRLDKFLCDNACYKSRNTASKFCEDNKVKVNDEFASKKMNISPGDVIEYISDTEQHVVAQDIPLNIKYEDEHILVISKQPGLVCHPSHAHKDNTLVNALINHCGEENLCDILDNKERLGIVHRLDADTSGLIICAKTNKAGLILQKNMKEHTTSRHYKALVYGNVKQNTGKIDVALIRVVNKRPKIIPSTSPKAKYAITTFTTLQRYKTSFGEFSLLDCKLHTGRTHQIRSHMEFIGHPIVGDPLYNSGINQENDISKKINLNRQFLHSYKIGFSHPISNEYLNFEDDLAPDLAISLNNLLNN